MSDIPAGMDFTNPYPSARSPVLGRNVVATSQPLAAQAGLSMLARGGNAIDAALAAAMVLTVVEPTGCGLGSDAFAIVWDGAELHGLNASGRSPAGWTHERFAGLDRMPELGWDAVTVPGAVSAWAALSERFGSLPLTTVAEPAIGYARDGFAVSPIIARAWGNGLKKLGGQPGFAGTFAFDGRAPAPGDLVRLPGHAASLEAIAATGGEAFYRGDLAEKMVAFSRAHGGVLSLDDLASHKADWVGTVSVPFAGHVVHEIPPNGQGIAALAAMGILEAFGIGDKPVDHPDTMHLAVEAMKLALADALRFVTDSRAMEFAPEVLLDPAYLKSRAGLLSLDSACEPGHGEPARGGTVYLAAADSAGRMISFIQSNYMGFGSGVVVPGTGIALQNRGCSFGLDPRHPNVVAPGKRPFHTIIPGFAMTADGKPAMSFGVMGGPIQAQGHLQTVLRTLLYRQNPQAAADAPRWRVDKGRKVAFEIGSDVAMVEDLRRRGHDVTIEPTNSLFGFGGAQTIMATAAGYVAGSDPRKDGAAVAF